MIKAIFFDLDGVLTTDAKGSLTMSKNLCEAVPSLSVQKLLDCYRQDIELLNKGQRSLKEVWERVRTAFPQIPADDDLLLRILRKVPKNEAMFDLVRSLSGRYILGPRSATGRQRSLMLHSLQRAARPQRRYS